MKPFPLSLLVITFNEETHLRALLESTCQLVAEIIIVDSGSTDRTLEIAKEFGATTLYHPWSGYRDQKNWALQQATQPWVLSLDGDEALSPELQKSICHFFELGESEHFSGGAFARKTRFLGRWITHGDWYPDHQLRLFRRDKGEWVNPIHERLEVKGATKLLEGDLLHDSFPTIKDYLEKIDLFAEAFLEKEKMSPKRWSLCENLFRPCWRFFRAYFLKRGFLDGFPGFWIAFGTAFSVFVRYSKRYERELSNQKELNFL